MIKIDNIKAIEITKDKIREYRNPLLSQLDVEVMKNITNPEKLSEIEAEKQKLRDMTKDAEGKSVEELITLVNEIKGVI